MGYEKKNIKEIINLINKTIYLPAIQRKYVWEDKQITKLLDSIMLGYPIGTFLFWKVPKNVVNEKNYSMYEFIKDYHERDRKNNLPAPQPFPRDVGESYILAVLDGQQRLTSLYTALQGSISRKLPNKQWKNDEAFIKKELYFNLHSKKVDEEDEITYEFKFLSEKEYDKSNSDYKKAIENNEDTSNLKLWFKVKDILQYTAQELPTKVYIPLNIMQDFLAIENITLLHNKITNEELLNYYEVSSDSIDKVLDIFIRVNSGGTVLSKTDLLFSTIVSRWDDAREKIDEFLEKINNIGEGFRFNNDFIMRTCLYILDLSVTLKVESFKYSSIDTIKNNWTNISESIKKSIELLNEFGFSYETMVSNLCVMPIIYYIYNGGEYQSCKDEIKKYIIISQLKQIFGAASNSALTSIREELKKHKNETFKLEFLYNAHFTGDNKTLKYTEDEIPLLFENLTKGPYTFMILSLLYPNMKYSQHKFHQDHMHPHTSFDKDKIKNLVLPDGKLIDDDKIEEWQYKRDTLANLQILIDGENESKNDEPLKDWIEKEGINNIQYLPKNISYDLNNFDEFLSERKKLMIEKLNKILL